MKLSIAQNIVDLVNDGNVELMEEYSGRFMFGETTAGIVLNDGLTAQNLQNMIVENRYEQDEESLHDWEELVKVVSEARQDTMGLNGIIVY